MELNELLEVFDRLDILNNEPSPPEKEDKEEHEEESEYEDEEEEIRQIFPSHDALSERLRKTMYYGESDPCGGESLSLSLTEFSVSEFAKGEFRRLDQLNINRAGWISRESCASPTSLLLALLYLERLRSSNPGYLAQTSSTDVFLVSLMVASKFLNDDGEEGEVFNEIWASSAGMDKSQLNDLEIGFLSAIDWKIFVSQNEFGLMLDRLEGVIARDQVRNRGWATYTDLLVLSNKCEFLRLLELVVQTALKVTAVCISAYTASLFTMLGACVFLNSTPLGPRAVHQSMNTLLESLSFLQQAPTHPNPPLHINSSSPTAAFRLDFPLFDDEASPEEGGAQQHIAQILRNAPWSTTTRTKPLLLAQNDSKVADSTYKTMKRSCNRIGQYPPLEEEESGGELCRMNLLTARIDHCLGVR